MAESVIGSKYRINTIAKDLGVKGKDLSDILASKGITVKSNMAVLSPTEFDLLLDALTKENQISDIGGYMMGETRIYVERAEKDEEEKAEPVAEPKAEPKEEPKTETKAEVVNAPAAPTVAPKTQQPAAAAGQVNAAKAAEQQKKPVAPPKPKTTETDRMQRFAAPFDAKAAEQQKKQKLLQQKQQKQQVRERPAQQFMRSHASEEPMKVITSDDSTSQGRIAGTRVVDTRSSSTTVDLSKYDERVEKYIPDSARGFSGGRQKPKRPVGRGQQGQSRDPRDARERERLFAEKQRSKLEMEKRRRQLEITVPEEIVVSELALRLKVTAAEVVKRLFKMGVMATVNQTIDYDTAFLIADELGAKVEHEVKVTIEDKLFKGSDDNEDELLPRAPVVCVMGHVDHGKTSLLDKIRNTRVTAGEAGGITQAIGAYRVNIDGKDITFLDTPGHEAFTAMRARGAMATDIAILVVAADDGIMPQTIEAIHHAKAAGIDIVVAVNKMDKPGANPEGIKQNLTKYDLVPEEWGGDVMCVPVSAMTGMGIDELLEDVLLVAEMKNLRANPNRLAQGIVIEARLDRGRGPVATVLVQNGTLKTGDVVIAGTAVGRIRAMNDEKGKGVRAAGPSVPVEIVGLSEVPTAGDEFRAVEDERMARELADQRRDKTRQENFKSNSKASLDDLFNKINEGEKQLSIVVKADVMGSAEAVKASLEKLSNDEVKVSVIHSAAGGINENDVMLASASNAIIVGFSVRPDKAAIDVAERQGVEIRTYRIIYECIEEIEAAMKGMLAPTFRENLLGHAEVRQTIHVPNVGTIAGSYVQDGKITRKSMVRVLRDSVVIFEDKIDSLRRFKDDVKEVAAGYECGIGLDRFNDIRVGDILEAYEMVENER